VQVFYDPGRITNATIDALDQDSNRWVPGFSDISGAQSICISAILVPSSTTLLAEGLPNWRSSLHSQSQHSPVLTLSAVYRRTHIPSKTHHFGARRGRITSVVRCQSLRLL